MSTKCVRLLSLLIASFAAPASAQVPAAQADSVSRFLEIAGRAADRYADRTVAIREGYRRIGPDFPGMGEHWVQPGRLVSARFVADAPPILTYITIGGRPVLAGVAYALPLSARESPPAFPSPGDWHDHQSSVDVESLLIAPLAHAHGAHTGEPGAHADPASPRLSMLHAWLRSPNPDGIFAQDNWALPYLRLDVEPPAVVDPAAARALSFLSGGDEYYRALFRAAALLSDDEQRAVDRLISELRTELDAWRARQPASWSTLPGTTSHLRARWQMFWLNVQSAVRDTTWERLARFAPDDRSSHMNPEQER
jgi:hypothetical protein